MLEASPVATGFVICALIPRFWLLEWGFLLGAAEQAELVFQAPSHCSKPALCPQPCWHCSGAQPWHPAPAAASAGAASSGTSRGARLSGQALFEGVAHLRAWPFLCCPWGSACAGSSTPASRAATGFSRWPWGRDLMTACSGFPFSKSWLVMRPGCGTGPVWERCALGSEHRLPLWGVTRSSSQKLKERKITSSLTPQSF